METYAEQKSSPSVSFDGWEYDSDDNDEECSFRDEEYYNKYDNDDEWCEYLFCLEFGDALESIYDDKEEIPEADKKISPWNQSNKILTSFLGRFLVGEIILSDH